MDDHAPNLRIAMIGTRGVPAAYGGFETAVEEIGRRLASRGHRVTVYCRTRGDSKPRTVLGMHLVHLPALRAKALETLSHTGLPALHAMFARRQDVTFVFNAANAPFIPLLRRRRVAVATHVDGLEWKRGKWGRWGKRYYRGAEQLSVRWSDAIISDAQGISDYYSSEFGISTELISYGTNILRNFPDDKLAALGLEPGRFHLVVARFEPENHVDVIVRGYSASSATLPLVVVGSAPYAADYTRDIEAVAAADPRIRMVGGIWDQELLDQLYAHSLQYIHGHSVGGTNPSLLRAMGAGTAVAAYDVSFNQEVLAGEGAFFRTDDDVRRVVECAESGAEDLRSLGSRLQDRAERVYNWDVVTDAYEALALKLAGGFSVRGQSRGSRKASTWVDETATSSLEKA